MKSFQSIKKARKSWQRENKSNAASQHRLWHHFVATRLSPSKVSSKKKNPESQLAVTKAKSLWKVKREVWEAPANLRVRVSVQNARSPKVLLLLMTRPMTNVVETNLQLESLLCVKRNRQALVDQTSSHHLIVTACLQTSTHVVIKTLMITTLKSLPRKLRRKRQKRAERLETKSKLKDLQKKVSLLLAAHAVLRNLGRFLVPITFDHPQVQTHATTPRQLKRLQKTLNEQ